MFGQLKKVFGKILVDGADDSIEQTFSPAAAADKSLPRDIAEYIATGKPTNVLARIAAIPQIAEKVGVLCGQVWSLDGKNYAAHRALIAELGKWQSLQLLRLAQIYWAAAKAPTTAIHFQVNRQSVSAWSGGYEWLELFLRQITRSTTVWSAKSKAPPPVSLQTLEEMIVANQQDPAQVARGALIPDATSYALTSFKVIFQSFPDFKPFLERHAAVVREAFAHADFKVRVHALETIGVAGADPRIWREEIAALVVESSKLVRQAAEPLVRLHPMEFRDAIQRHAREDDNETRVLAVQAYYRVYQEQARDFLLARRAEEKAKKVVEALDDILRVPAASADAAACTDEWNLPPVPAFATDAPLDSSVHADLKACLEKAHAEALAGYERIKHQRWAGKFEADASDGLIDALFAELQGRGLASQRVRIPEWRAWREGSKRILQFAGHPAFNLIHLVRWCRFWVSNPKETYWFHWSENAVAAYAKTHGLPGLREFAAAFTALDLDADAVGQSYLGQLLGADAFGRVTLFRQPAEGLWPYFAERLHLLETALGARPATAPSDYMASYRERFERRNALIALAAFPRSPKRLLPLLWEIALKGMKAERQDAQVALSREPDTVDRLIANLANGQMEVRAEAAAWLARLRATGAKDALWAALKRERKETAQSAMMLALESFGVPTAELVDRSALEAEAAKQAAKELPADLQWFPFATAPSVRWADNGKPVPAELIRWLIVQAFKLKDAEPGPLLRTYSGFFSAMERGKLARFMVEAWIAQDTIPAHTAEEAARLAEAQTQQMKQFYQNPQYAAAWDEQQHYRAAYNHLLGACKGSAIGSKGILAVAGAFGAADLAPLVHRYVKQYYGLRGAQSKALLQMLAWIDDPNAIQVLLAIGNRFRTKGIQEEASRLCQELAERKNWTLDELADRTIPTASLDEDGALELDFGGRVFTARLNAELTLTLTNAEGRELSSLPDPNKSDDEEKAKQAKQALSASRKELKTVLKLQEERLYEAMCTQRKWPFGDFRRFILSHPIVGRLCERLVWSVVVDQGKVVSTFRPLPDKTLTNTDDDAVEVADNASIQLAHEVTLPAAQRDAWLAHFADYKVEPLFAQFGKPPYILDEARREESEIGDFRGHVVESFKLRSRLTKLGYTRGPAQDGGWFMEYLKRFPGLGIQAAINFSGSPLPEENRPVALISLSFSRIGQEGSVDPGGGTRLGDLPPVLVNECWNDIRLAAADGKGFDPNWEKAVQY